MVRQPLWLKTSSWLRSHDHTHFDSQYSVGLLWTSDRPVAETSTWQHTTLTTVIGPSQRPLPDNTQHSQQWSARRTDLYLTTHNNHNRQISMSPATLEPTIPTSERPQINALEWVATGIGTFNPRANKQLKTGVDSRVNERNVDPVTFAVSNSCNHATLRNRIICSGVAREWWHPLKCVSISAG
jgi:hypothetical protein